jgi:tRNA dimethylallyltransferase
MLKRTSKLIVILGPTASGKSELVVKLAKKFNGEVISADSRQIYKGLDIGTGKITKKQMKDIPHHLLDVVSPQKRFTVAEYRKLAVDAIDKILKKEKVPILCGGTGFYIQAVVDGIVIPEVPPDWKLRKKLEKKSVKELYQILKKLDQRRAKTIERGNPRRLIRAIEIVLKTKKPIPSLKQNPLPCPVLMLGIKKSPQELKKLIEKRLLRWLKTGLIDEIKKLHLSGLAWKRIKEFGMEYPYIADYIQGKLNYHDMVELSQKELEHYSKRQMTWFKKDKRINWIKNYKEAEKKIGRFLR